MGTRANEMPEKELYPPETRFLGQPGFWKNIGRNQVTFPPQPGFRRRKPGRATGLGPETRFLE